MAGVPPSDIFTRRVCLELEGMESLAVLRDVEYGEPSPHRQFDLYYPPGQAGAGGWPAVVIVSGYTDARVPRVTPLTYKEIGWTVSMCQLIALSGMAAIAYTNEEPAADLQALFEHIHLNAGSLGIDPASIGVLAVSGNVPTAVATMMQDARRTPVCAVFGYGCVLDLDGATDVADMAKQFGFANPGTGRTVADLRRDVPLLLVRAGRDQFAGMNASIDRFIRHGLAENLPMTVVNNAEGAHAFDLFEDTATSRDIIRQTLRFLRLHLGGRGHLRPALPRFCGS